jgi:hypothetical protein
MISPNAQKVAAIKQIATVGGCQRVEFRVEGNVMGLHVLWKGEPYELTFDIGGQTPRMVDIQLDLLRSAIERLVNRRRQVQR